MAHFHSYPMMVDLRGRRVLVVGGGQVAERKISSLLTANAEVVVISPTATPVIWSFVKEKRILLHQRSYQSLDGAGCFLVIAATNRPLVNQQVYDDAKGRAQWINVVDQPSLCNFTVPSVVKRGKLTISISTEGSSPALAKQIRQELENKYGHEYELLLELTQEIRLRLQWEIDDPKIRYQLMKELVSDHWIQVCRLRPSSARQEMLDWLGQHVKEKGGAKCGN
jgi:precorrin-2 dehydrogenase / sirohydrochlorin ferrochelatase